MKLKENFSLQALNTFGIQAYARYFGAFDNVGELDECLSAYRDLSPEPEGQTLILGGGSNLLFTRDFPGLAVKNNIKGIIKAGEDEKYCYLRVGAGENWHQLVMHCIDQQLAGIENLSLIPGNVGASPMQNIGAYGVEIKDVFHELEAFHLHDRKITAFSAKECEFGYRDSVFKNRYTGEFVILSVTFRLNKHARYNVSYGAIEQELEKMGVKELSLKAVSQAVINIRSSKLPDPKQIGNAGSFFKNPTIPAADFEKLKTAYPAIPGYPASHGVKVAAGWLIEQCGWKGYRSGDAGCHSQQALVLVNYGQATGKEIFSLSEKIAESIKDKFEIDLEKEVNII